MSTTPGATESALDLPASSPAPPPTSVAKPSIPRPPNLKRDRIVVLGRRGSGKTVFLSRLYEQLWNSKAEVHMRALSGDAHSTYVSAVDQMANGHWPASTLGSQYADIEVTYRGETRLMVALDYPGEIFRRAFVENMLDDATQELVDHVDRACAVMLLLDPSNALRGSTEERIDDDYGMVQALRRIREWPGGERIPIAVVLTKCDRNKQMLRAEGGLKAFARKHYPNMLRVIGDFKIFPAAAVHSKASRDGKLAPNTATDPIGLIEPLAFCLEGIQRREDREAENEAYERRAAAIHDMKVRDHEKKKRAVLFWSIFWSTALIVLGAIAIIAWQMAM